MSFTAQNLKLDPSKDSHLEHLLLMQELATLRSSFEPSSTFNRINFQQKTGTFCLLPAATPIVMTSHSIKGAVEENAFHRINKIFCKEFLPALRERWFCWDQVELPLAMQQRLELDASIAVDSERHDEPFLFLDPLTSTPNLPIFCQFSVADTTVLSAPLSPLHSSLFSGNFLWILPSDNSFLASESEADQDLSFATSHITNRLEPSFALASPGEIRVRRLSQVSPTIPLLAEGITVRCGRQAVEPKVEGTGKVQAVAAHIPATTDHTPTLLPKFSPPIFFPPPQKEILSPQVNSPLKQIFTVPPQVPKFILAKGKTTSTKHIVNTVVTQVLPALSRPAPEF
ncbi:hypothetical protein HYDPIDRAFT_28033 [Hydnomerulius pinastri MD-312]|uniref:Uncharacterized protein n=1 Tax=Hydnomerulius pinastri MD-312 TaxID=994086 RepID=A0A0C9WGF2_9AGAM|nr:hypothetical protein HYDPIDRAFT_28033 [Hydnomerulius pinastri MD-312]